MQIREELADDLIIPANAAVSWLNERDGTNFHLSGLANDDCVAPQRVGDACEMGLVLCDVDICSREQVRVQKTATGFDFSAVDSEDALVPALLDPPEGVRRGWLDTQLSKYEFVLLLFYRGRW